MSVIDQVKAHQSARQRKIVEAPGWGEDGGTLKIWVAPFTVAEKDKIDRFATKDGVKSIVRVLIMKAEDEDGKKIFSLEDRIALTDEADPDIVADVAEKIMLAFEEDSIAKN